MPDNFPVQQKAGLFYNKIKEIAFQKHWEVIWQASDSTLSKEKLTESKQALELTADPKKKWSVQIYATIILSNLIGQKIRTLQNLLKFAEKDDAVKCFNSKLEQILDIFSKLGERQVEERLKLLDEGRISIPENNIYYEMFSVKTGSIDAGKDFFT